MNQRAMIGRNSGADASCGGATVGARSATIGTGLRSAVVCVASSLLLVSLTASADSEQAADDFFWEAVKGCKTESGTRKYLAQTRYTRHASEAQACLTRWEDDRQAWDRVRECNDLDEVKRFLRESPESPHAAEAARCIASLELRQRIERLLTGCRRALQSRENRIGTGRKRAGLLRRGACPGSGQPGGIRGTGRHRGALQRQGRRGAGSRRPRCGRTRNRASGRDSAGEPGPGRFAQEAGRPES